MQGFIYDEDFVVSGTDYGYFIDYYSILAGDYFEKIISSFIPSENELNNKFSIVAKQTLDFLRDKMIRDGVLYRVYGFSNDNLKSLYSSMLMFTKSILYPIISPYIRAHTMRQLGDI